VFISLSDANLECKDNSLSFRQFFSVFVSEEKREANHRKKNVTGGSVSLKHFLKCSLILEYFFATLNMYQFMQKYPESFVVHFCLTEFLLSK